MVPCHRVLGKSGELTGYHWGITRKRAMLGWEAGQVGAALAGGYACISASGCNCAAAIRISRQTGCIPHSPLEPIDDRKLIAHNHLGPQS